MLAVALVTLVIEGLRRYVPVLSLGVALRVRRAPDRGRLGARLRGRRLGREHARVQLLLPRAGAHVHAADSKNWFALAVFVVIAVVVSELAARSRRRAREAALLAEIAGSLLERGTVGGELERISGEAARALQVESAQIELGEPGRRGGRPARSSRAGGASGAIRLEGRGRGGAAARRRLLPALASLLGVAIDRERLEREALEAEALRRATR